MFFQPVVFGRRGVGMADDLRFIPFTANMVSRASVQAFDCGSAEWESEIAEWLKAAPGQGGAVDDLSHGNRVWLYATEDGELVGVGSLGDSLASWPKNSSPKLAATCITWLAVDVRHRGKGYGQQILDHLLNEARNRADQFPLVVLYVHTANTQAAKWYANAVNNFVPIGKPREINGKLYQRMVLSLVQGPPKS